MASKAESPLRARLIALVKISKYVLRPETMKDDFPFFIGVSMESRDDKSPIPPLTENESGEPGRIETSRTEDKRPLYCAG